jgi:hypothetical protein
VVRLDADGAPGAAESTCSAATAQEFELTLGPGAVRWAVRAAATITETVVAEVSSFGDIPGARTTLRMGVEGGVLGTLASIQGNAPVDPKRTPEAAQSAQDFVHRGVPLVDVWSGVRYAHRELLGLLIELGTSLVPADRQAAEIAHATRLSFEFVDSLVQDLGAAYSSESERWHATAAAVREELVRAVLDAAPVDLTAAATTLRYRLSNRYHLGLVVWPEDVSTDRAVTHLQDAAVGYLAAAGAQETLLVPQGRARLWAWGNRPTPFELEADPEPQGQQPPEAKPTARRRTLPDGVRISVGGPERDVAGFRHGHADAVEAYRVAQTFRHVDAAVVRFAAVELLALVTEDADRARRFLARELGGLAATDPATRELRRTVRAYLDSHSAQTAAGRLFVARNTVNYRLRRAEQLRGRPLTERQLELGVALILADATQGRATPDRPHGQTGTVAGL